MSANPVPHIFIPGDTVRNKNTGSERIVRKVNLSIIGDDVLLVRKDESEEKSILWSWGAQNCELVSAAPLFNVHDRVTLGTGTVERVIKDTRIHNKTGEMQYRIDVDGEKEKWVIASALHLVAAADGHDAPVGDKMKETDSNGGMRISDLWAQESAADPDTDDPLFRAAQAIVDEQDKVRAAEERAKVAEKLVAKLEAKLREMEVCITQPQPVPVAQAECWQIKTTMFKVGLPDHDKQYTDHLNEGWKESSVTSVVNSSDEIYSVVVFKKMLSTPPQPTRGTAGHHAGLTSPFVSSEVYRARQQQAIEPDAILEPVESAIKLGPIGTSIKEIGVEQTAQAMNYFAIQDAINRGRERIANMPVFNQPLHTLKASN